MIKITLNGTELISFKITFNTGDIEKNGAYETFVYDQTIIKESDDLEDNSTRIMIFTDQHLGIITVNYYDEKGAFKRNKMFPYCSIHSTEAIVKEIESHEKI